MKKVIFAKNDSNNPVVLAPLYGKKIPKKLVGFNVGFQPYAGHE